MPCRSGASSIQQLAAADAIQDERVVAPKQHKPRTFRQISDHGTEVSTPGDVIQNNTADPINGNIA